MSSRSLKPKKSVPVDAQGWVVDGVGLDAVLLNEPAARAAWGAFHAKYPVRTLRKGEKSPVQLLKAARDSR